MWKMEANNYKDTKRIGNIAVISSHTRSLCWFRIDMMKAFISKGYDVVAVGQESESKWSNKFAQDGIVYKQIYVERNGTNPIGDLRTLKELNSFLREEKPDKIFCYQAKTVIYTCLAAKKNKIAEVYPLIPGLGSVFMGDSIKGKIVKFILVKEYKIALKQSRKVMFQNKDSVVVFVHDRIVDESKCVIINGSGVDIKRFSVTPLPQQTVFLMISRLIKDKGVMEYLDASRLIKKRYPNIRFLLVGPYDSNPSSIKPEELQKYVEDGTIEYFGEQEDVRPYINQASVFVLPSYYEGTPKTVLENMSCGRAIITTDAPGCRETVTDGVNGYLVPVKDAGAVADKMQEFIDKPELAIEMGSRGRKIVEEKYDVNKVNESIMEIMNI
ncbi:MAG: glycosyltransferase family 4 protein [Lachnospiraceae bacterium]|nr:glycosyltransferase family 4 protein [Lachnospiraceae bacterium]